MYIYYPEHPKHIEQIQEHHTLPQQRTDSIEKKRATEEVHTDQLVTSSLTTPVPVQYPVASLQ